MKSKALFIIWLCVAMVCASFIIAFSNPDVRLWAALVSLVDAFIFVFFGMNEGSYEDHKDLCIQTNKGVAGGGFICVFFACLFLAVSN